MKTVLSDLAMAGCIVAALSAALFWPWNGQDAVTYEALVTSEGSTYAIDTDLTASDCFRVIFSAAQQGVYGECNPER
mgnify:CR=1 FL=1